MTTDPTSRAYFEELHDQAYAAGNRSDSTAAFEALGKAEQWAKSYGNPDDLDLVECCRNFFLIVEGEGDNALRNLQKMLMRSASPKIRHLAAYNISLFFYEFRPDLDKSKFYVEQAFRYAEQTGSADYMTLSHNQFGNIFIRQSKFEDAIDHYQKAREFVAEDRAHYHLPILLNMGYCHLASGEYSLGFNELFQVRRGFIRDRIHQGSSVARLRLSFCFGYLEIGKHHQARLHGLVGLKLAEDCGEPDLIKKALYLLGEAEKYIGDDFEAYKHYVRLQEQFYPEHDALPDLLFYTETRKLVNLWA